MTVELFDSTHQDLWKTQGPVRTKYYTTGLKVKTELRIQILLKSYRLKIR